MQDPLYSQQQDEEEDDPLSQSWLLPRLIITVLVVVIAYIYYSEPTASAKAEITAEQQAEAKQRRLERLEQLEKQQQQNQNQPEGKSPAKSRTSVPKTVIASVPKSTAPSPQSKPQAPIVNTKAAPKQNDLPTTPVVATAAVKPETIPFAPQPETAGGMPSNADEKDSATLKPISIPSIPSTRHEQGDTAKPNTPLTTTTTTTTTKAQVSSTKATTTKPQTPAPELTSHSSEKSEESENDENSSSSNNMIDKKRKTSPQPQSQQQATTAKKKGLVLSPRDVVLQALSDITGCHVVTKDTQSTAKKTNQKKSLVVISDTLLPVDATWKDVAQIDTNVLFRDLSKILRQYHSDDSTTSHHYAASHNNNNKWNEGLLWKASEWFHTSPRWIRDHCSKACPMDEDGRAGLQHLLDQFQQQVVVDTIVHQWHTELQQEAEYYLQSKDGTGPTNNSMVEDDDDDVDLGLFADESYGGSSEHLPAIVDDDSNNNRPKKNTLLQKLFALLADDVGAAKVLTKPFVSRLVQAYDEMNTNHDSSLAMILLQECLRKLPSPDRKAAMEWEATQRHLSALSNLLVVSQDAAKALAETVVQPTAAAGGALILTDGVQWETHSMLRSLLSLVAFTVPRFSSHSTSNSAPYHNLLPHAFHAMMCSSMGVEYPVCLYTGQGYHASIANYHGAVKHARNTMRQARTVGALVMKKIAASSAAGTPPQRKGGLLFDWLGHVLKTK